MQLLKLLVKATGRKGLPQGEVLSPALSNLYLNEVDRMLERAHETTRRGPYTYPLAIGIFMGANARSA